MSYEDPFKLDKAHTPENEVIHDEEKQPPSERARLEKAIEGAHYLVNGHKSSIVPKVEKLIEEFGVYEKFPKPVVQKIADDYGSEEPIIVQAVYLVLKGQDKEI